MYLSKYFIIIFFSTVLLSACTSKKDTTVGTGSLYFHLHTDVGTTEVDHYDTVYTSTDGRKISLHLAQLYISGIQLIKSDGAIYNIPNTVVLKTQPVEVYLLGNVPAGDYEQVMFNVGLDQMMNQKLPTSPSDTILNQPSMWFSNTAQAQAYVFLNVQGKVDTTAAKNATNAQMVPFSYKIGTNANYEMVMFPQKPFSVLPNQMNYVHLTIDYAKLFTNIQLFKNSNLFVSSIADNANPLAAQVRDNISSMFHFE